MLSASRLPENRKLRRPALASLPPLPTPTPVTQPKMIFMTLFFFKVGHISSKLILLLVLLILLPIVGNRDGSSGADTHEGPLLCLFTDPQPLLVLPSSTTCKGPSLVENVSGRLSLDSRQAPEAGGLRRKEKFSIKMFIYAGKVSKMTNDFPWA